MDTPNRSREKLQSTVSPWLTYIAYILGFWIILPLYFGRLVVKGKENIPKNGSVIVTPTHRSRWDALIIPYAVGRVTSGRDLHFMVSSSEMKGFQGWCIRRLGGFPINSKQLIGGGLDYSVEILKKEKMLVIFPEGGIFRGSQIRTLKRGTAHIVLGVKSEKPNNKIANKKKLFLIFFNIFNIVSGVFFNVFYLFISNLPNYFTGAS